MFFLIFTLLPGWNINLKRELIKDNVSEIHDQIVQESLATRRFTSNPYTSVSRNFLRQPENLTTYFYPETNETLFPHRLIYKYSDLSFDDINQDPREIEAGLNGWLAASSDYYQLGNGAGIGKALSDIRVVAVYDDKVGWSKEHYVLADPCEIEALNQV